MAKTQTPAEEFTSRVTAYLIDEDRTPAWLSRKSGISYNTLRRQLDRPDLLTFVNAVALSSATGLHPIRRDEVSR